MASSAWLSYLVQFLLLYCTDLTQGGLIRGPWESWGSCSSSCDGQQTRKRSCQANEGESCEGQTTQTRSCSEDVCVTTPIIISIVLGVLILLSIGVLVILIKRRIQFMNSEENKFNINAVEEFYDQSLRRGSSYYGDYPSTSRSFHGDGYSSTYAPSVASSRATIPTIAPYLPELEEEGDYRKHLDNDSYTDNSGNAGLY